jgi:hypothetical protein
MHLRLNTCHLNALPQYVKELLILQKHRIISRHVILPSECCIHSLCHSSWVLCRKSLNGEYWSPEKEIIFIIWQPSITGRTSVRIASYPQCTASAPATFLDCHQPAFGWITNDCLGTAFIVLYLPRTWQCHHSQPHCFGQSFNNFERTIQIAVTFHANYKYTCSSSPYCDINWLVICTDE